MSNAQDIPVWENTPLPLKKLAHYEWQPHTD